MALPATNNLTELINKARLTTYTTELKTYIAAQIKIVADKVVEDSEIDNKITTAITALGTIVNYKGTKDSINELPDDAKAGDLWFVKQGAAGTPAGTGDFYEEYLFTGTTWEYIGKTMVSLDGYLTETALYKGTAGTGTITNPADDSILAKYTTKNDLYAGAAGTGTVSAPAAGTILKDILDKIDALTTRADEIETYLSNATIISEADVKALFA